MRAPAWMKESTLAPTQESIELHQIAVFHPTPNQSQNQFFTYYISCSKGGQWQLALNLLSLMPQLRILPDGVSYNAAMDAVSGMGVGYALFREALGLGMYPQFRSKSDSTVNLHCMSCGAAVLAVRWWLAEVVPDLLCGPTIPKLEIITGWGKSRKEWDTTDVQDKVFQLLQSYLIQGRIDQNNKGVITIDGRQLKSSNLRKLFTPPS
ncbi:unnamed protein product [Polarella glacialis]|uniref:Pentatricopeptide repeat-containing protein n=1 Tax=Polarella glacialis TaxID=89957 RepID=A0A813DTS9_POLGL|nr:unnamed protein product [Polarella glacialis]